MHKITDNTLAEPQVSLGVYDTNLRIVENMERVLNFIAFVEPLYHDWNVGVFSDQVNSINPRLIFWGQLLFWSWIQIIIILAIVLNSAFALYLGRFDNSNIVFEYSLCVNLKYLFDALSAQMTNLLVVFLQHLNGTFVAYPAVATRHDHSISHATHTYYALLEHNRWHWWLGEFLFTIDNFILFVVEFVHKFVS